MRAIPPPPREIPPEIAKQIRRTAFVWLMISFSLLPGLIGIGVLYYLDDPFQAQRLAEDGKDAAGLVSSVEVDNLTHRGKHHPWKIRYSFKADDGKTYTGLARTYDASYIEAHAPGRPIAVRYATGDPGDSYPADLEKGMIPWFVYLVFALLCVEGFVGYTGYRMKTGWRRALYEDGAAGEGEVLSVKVVPYIRVGRKHPYDIEYRFKDELGRESTGRTRSYQFEAAAALKPGDKVAVIYDQAGSQKNMAVL